VFVRVMAYHEGELEMQRRAGVRALADRVGRIIGDDVPPAAAAFLAAQRFVILATVSGDGAITASILGGSSGFASARDEHTVVLATAFGLSERVAADIDATQVVGLLAIDQPNRRRIRVNGTATRDGQRIVIATREVYSNCPQYIRPRMAVDRVGQSAPIANHSIALSTPQQRWIADADTFFLATAHGLRGADASHRGGPAGFVTIDSATRLHWPDFPGNNMFNSLGNLAANPRCGLLFVDFPRGATLQLRGSARVHGDEERKVVFDVDEVVETTDAIPLRWD
jgi:predicted pyridoxine 5'-phosphate oxidase superfamily flavin-nucleotide-binding protein